MPAVIRGAQKGGRGPARGRGTPAYSPTKLKGAAAVGFDPRAAVWIAAGVVGAAVVLSMTLGAGETVARGAGEVGDRIGVALGFRLNTLTIRGAQPAATAAIAQASGLSQGDAILGVNLEKLREKIEGVGWVKSAKVQRLLPDTIVVAVQPRTLLAVWQHEGAVNVVDTDGQVIPEADAAGFPELPLVVGEGANEAAGAVLPLVAARPRLLAKVDAFQRVDGRRWRLKLKDGGLVDLPAQGEEGALIRFDQLDAQSHLLDMGFDRVDLRDPTRADVRLKGAAPVVAATTDGAVVQGL